MLWMSLKNNASRTQRNQMNMFNKIRRQNSQKKTILQTHLHIINQKMNNKMNNNKYLKQKSA